MSLNVSRNGIPIFVHRNLSAQEDESGRLHRMGYPFENQGLGDAGEINNITRTVKGLLGPFQTIDLVNGSHGVDGASNVDS